MDPMIEEYLSYLSQVKKVSPNTLESYRRDILKYHDYMTKVQMRDLCAANRTIILDFLLTMQKQGMATSSILRMLASLRSLYRFLLQKQYIHIRKCCLVLFLMYIAIRMRKLQLQRESLQVLLKCKRAVLLPGAATGAGRNVKKNCLFCRRLSQDIRLPVFNL